MTKLVDDTKNVTPKNDKKTKQSDVGRKKKHVDFRILNNISSNHNINNAHLLILNLQTCSVHLQATQLVNLLKDTHSSRGSNSMLKVILPQHSNTSSNSSMVVLLHSNSSVHRLNLRNPKDTVNHLLASSTSSLLPSREGTSRHHPVIPHSRVSSSNSSTSRDHLQQDSSASQVVASNTSSHRSRLLLHSSEPQRATSSLCKHTYAVFPLTLRFQQFDSSRSGQLNSFDLQRLLEKDATMEAREDCVKMVRA